MVKMHYIKRCVILLQLLSFSDGFDFGGLSNILRRATSSVQNGGLYHPYETAEQTKAYNPNLLMQTRPQSMQQSATNSQPFRQMARQRQGSMRHRPLHDGTPNTVMLDAMASGPRSDMSYGLIKKQKPKRVLPRIAPELTQGLAEALAAEMANGISQAMPQKELAQEVVQQGMNPEISLMMNSGMAQSAQGINLETIQAIPGMSQDMSQSMSQGTPQGMTQGMAQGMAQGMPQGMTQGMAQGMAQGMPQGIAQGMAQGMPQGMTQGISQGMSQAIPQAVPQNIPKGIPQRIYRQRFHQRVPQPAPLEISQIMPEGAPQVAVQGAVQGTAQGAVQGTVQDFPQRFQQRAQQAAPLEISQIIPQGAPQEIPQVAIQGAVQEVPQRFQLRTPQEIPQVAVQGSIPEMAQEIPQGAPQAAPQATPLGVSQNIPQEKVALELPQGLSEPVPHRNQHTSPEIARAIFEGKKLGMRGQLQNGIMPTAQFSPMLRALGDFKSNLIEQHKDALDGIRRAQLKQIIETKKAENGQKEGKIKKKLRRKKGRMSRARSKNRRRYHHAPMRDITSPLGSSSKKVVFVDDFLKNNTNSKTKQLQEISPPKLSHEEPKDDKLTKMQEFERERTEDDAEINRKESSVPAFDERPTSQNNKSQENNIEIIYDASKNTQSELINPAAVPTSTENMQAIYSAFMGSDKTNITRLTPDASLIQAIYVNPEKLQKNIDDLIMSDPDTNYVKSITKRSYKEIDEPPSNETNPNPDLPLWSIMAYFLKLNESLKNTTKQSTKNITGIPQSLPVNRDMYMRNMNPGLSSNGTTHFKNIQAAPTNITIRNNLKNPYRRLSMSSDTLSAPAATPKPILVPSTAKSSPIRYIQDTISTASTGPNPSNSTDLNMQGSYILKSYTHNIISNNNAKLGKGTAKGTEFKEISDGINMETTTTRLPFFNLFEDGFLNSKKNDENQRTDFERKSYKYPNHKENLGLFYDISQTPEQTSLGAEHTKSKEHNLEDYGNSEEFIIEVLESSTRPSSVVLTPLDNEFFHRLVSNQDHMNRSEIVGGDITNRNNMPNIMPSNRVRTLTTQTEATVLRTRFEDDKSLNIKTNTPAPPLIDPNNKRTVYTRSEFDKYPFRIEEEDSDEVPCSNSVNLDQNGNSNTLTVTKYRTNAVSLHDENGEESKSKDETFSMLTNEDMYNAGMKDPKYAPFYNDYQLIQVIPKVINELKSQELSQEQLKAYEVTFGDLWPLMLNESYSDDEEEDVLPSISTILNTEMYITKISNLQKRSANDSFVKNVANQTYNFMANLPSVLSSVFGFVHDAVSQPLTMEKEPITTILKEPHVEPDLNISLPDISQHNTNENMIDLLRSVRSTSEENTQEIIIFDDNDTINSDLNLTTDAPEYNNLTILEGYSENGTPTIVYDFHSDPALSTTELAQKNESLAQMNLHTSKIGEDKLHVIPLPIRPGDEDLRYVQETKEKIS